MRKLFNMEQGANQGTMTMPWWSYVQSGLQKNLEQIVMYYRRFPAAVESSHFLGKVLTNIGIYRDATFDQFFETIYYKTLGAVSSLGMTTALKPGQVFDGVFYGAGVKELIIGHDDEFDVEDARIHWRDLRPVQVLSHPKSDLGMQVPDGKSYSVEEGVAVIAINLPMLALQYREFRLLEDEIAEKLGESPRSMMQFIYAYPLTNMLYSHLDGVVFNRLQNALHNVPQGYCRKRHPFNLIDYTDKLNEVQGLQLEMLEVGGRKFYNIMRNIPLVTAKDLYEYSQLPDVVPTRQVLWALVTARIPLLAFLFQCSKTNPRVANGNDINHILRTFQLLNIDKALKATLPLDLYFDYRNTLVDMYKQP